MPSFSIYRTYISGVALNLHCFCDEPFGVTYKGNCTTDYRDPIWYNGRLLAIFAVIPGPKMRSKSGKIGGGTQNRKQRWGNEVPKFHLLTSHDIKKVLNEAHLR